MHPSIPSSLSNGIEGGIEDNPTNQPTQTSFRFDPNPPLTTMRAPTILCWYTSTFLSFHLTSAAPGGRGGGREGEGVAVAIDFGAVTEKFPLPDASQQQQQQVVAAKTLQREQKISKSERPEPVRLWIDDFGNIEAVPIVSKDGLDDDEESSSSLSSSSPTEKSAPGSSGINQQPPPSQPPNPQKKTHNLAPPAPAPRQQRQLQDFRTKAAMINWKWPSNFSSELSGLLYFVFGGILLLGGLITLVLSLSTRRRNIRILGMGHRRGRSRFSL